METATDDGGSTGIEALFACLDDTASALRRAATAAGDTEADPGFGGEAADAAGDETVARAIRSFVDAWRPGLRHLAGDISGLAANVEAARLHYDDLDRTLSRAAGG